MDSLERKKHWENIYSTRDLKEVSWFQPTAATSLKIIKEFNPSSSATIIDVGGGDSFLAENLIDAGYKNITVLDISEKALQRAKKRAGVLANEIKWQLSDITRFESEETFDIWHDRAAFHFLNSKEDIDKYLERITKYVKPGGHAVIGTFSDKGPILCSGINIKQYTEESMCKTFNEHFEKINCFTLDHQTPKGTMQNFIFCSFKRKENN